MNTWQALKKIVRDQFTKPVRSHPAYCRLGYRIVNVGARHIMTEEFPTREAAQAKIDRWNAEGGNTHYLKVCSIAVMHK